MSAKALIFTAAGATALWLIVRGRQAAGDVDNALTDLETIAAAPLSALGITAPSPKVANMANAIAAAEGFFVPGTIPDVTHNPGDLKIGGQTYGNTGITVFGSDGEGFAALYRQLNLIIAGKSANYKLTDSIAAMGARWAPAGDNNVVGAWSKNVAGQLGVDVSTPLRSVLV